MVFTTPPDGPLAQAHRKQMLCRFCEEKVAGPLPELGLPGTKYKLFCSVEDAALYGIKCAIEAEPPQR